MKKIITLFASVLLVVSAFAQFNSGDQKGYNNGKDYSYNDNGFKKGNDRRNGRYHFSIRERDMQVANINREYDRKIMSVKHRLFVSRSKKEAIICSLENQRKDEIREVYARFNNRNNRFDDHDSKRHW